MASYDLSVALTLCTPMESPACDLPALLERTWHPQELTVYLTVVAKLSAYGC